MSNNCNHSKEKPTFIIDKSINKRPLLIKTAQERLESYYTKKNNYLERLNYLSSLDKSRAKRSERREAIINIGKILLSLIQLDYDGSLNGFRVGLFKGNQSSIESFSYTFLQAKTGYTKKRISRALKDLKRAGYINMKFDISKNNNTFSTTFNIFIKRAFFYGLNFKKKTLEKCIHFKRKSVEKVARLSYGVKRTAQETMDGIHHLKSIKELLAKKLEKEAIEKQNRSIFPYPS